MSLTMDYEKENKYLPESLRQIVSVPNRLTKHSQTTFLRMFEGNELRAIRNNYYASEIACGYSIEVNSSNLMSGIAPKMLEIMTRKIASRIKFESKDTDLETFKEAFSEEYFTMKLKEAVSNTLKTGRDYMLLDAVGGRVSIRNFEMFRGKAVMDSFGNIQKAEMYITQDSKEALEAYTIVEKRFYKSTKDKDTGIETVKAYQRYEVTKLSWNDDRKDATDRVTYDDAKKIPQHILETYKGIKFNQDIELETRSLGVYVLDNTTYNTKYPYSHLPESQFINIMDMVIEMETARTYKEMDKNLGRGRAMIPTLMKAQRGDNPMRGTFLEPYESMSVEDSKPTPVQFDIRAEQWRTEINGTVGDICAAFGLSVLDYDPRLLQAGQRTDDEINAMTDITYSTVTDKREIITPAINAMLNDIAAMLGLEERVQIRWSMSSIINPTKNTALVRSQLEAGLISRKKALEKLNPDASDKEIEEELEAINNEKSAVTTITDEYNQF